MALELRQSLILTQQLIMTPQLQQAIKLLQLSRLELLETIHQEMETNPMLEEQSLDEADEEKGFEEGGDKSDQILSEVTVKEKVREDVDWDNYLSEYNTGRAESPYERRDIPSKASRST
jgi:RNA polymerase sigma-54 factor